LKHKESDSNGRPNWPACHAAVPASRAASRGEHGGPAQRVFDFLNTSQRGDLLAALNNVEAAVAQLGEHQNEDLKVPGSIPASAFVGCQHASGDARRLRVYFQSQQP
jgi:hypothetical protein